MQAKKVLSKGVIAEYFRETGDFVSTVFSRHKKDGNFRTIFNLKCIYMSLFSASISKWNQCKMILKLQKQMPGLQVLI